MSGKGFKTLPPLAILFKLFQFLKSLGLKSVGLGLECMPFHSGWELVEWVPKSVDLGENYVEILRICDEIEEEDHLEVIWPQIELNIENPSDMGEPSVEVAGVAPIVEVEDEYSVEMLEAKASVEKDAGAEAEGTGAEPVHESVEERTGAEPVHMDV